MIYTRYGIRKSGVNGDVTTISSKILCTFFAGWTNEMVKVNFSKCENLRNLWPPLYEKCGSRNNFAAIFQIFGKARKKKKKKVIFRSELKNFGIKFVFRMTEKVVKKFSFSLRRFSLVCEKFLCFLRLFSRSKSKGPKGGFRGSEKLLFMFFFGSSPLIRNKSSEKLFSRGRHETPPCLLSSFYFKNIGIL